MLKKQRFLAGALMAIGIGAMMATPLVQADGDIRDAWVNMYPDSLSYDNAGCVLCHVTPSGGGFNPYGAEVWVSGISGAETWDSDADPTGSDNLTEINADAQPGWKEGDDPTGVIGDLDPVVTTVPDIAVSPLAIDFGAVTVGMSQNGTVNIANDGSADLEISDLALLDDTEISLVSPPTTPFTVAASTSVNVTVEYIPANEGADNDTLNIASDSPGEELVAVALTGTGIPVVVEECVASADPASIDFGSVEIGTTVTLSTTITNDGGAECAVDAIVINGGVFNLVSASSFTVAPGASADVEVNYSPDAVGDNSGSLTLDVVSPANTITVPLSGSGFEAPVEAVDLDIKSFSVTKKVSLARVKPLTIKLTVSNKGAIEGSAPATLTGVQNGGMVHEQTLDVTDAVGNGSTRYTLDPYTPDAAGEILWTLVIDDGDPDDDVATATTVVKP